MTRERSGINVLSFFDGISAGQESLRQLGVQVDNYYAIEVDTEAIKVTQSNFPETKQVGNILRFDKAERKFVNSLPVIDLVFAGSPCQGFSKSGKGKGLEDPRSKLFFNFHKIWKKINQKRSKEGLPPVPFFFENVVMHKDFAQQITDHLGVDYYAIDAIDYSPCARNRYYWANLNVPESIFSKYKSNAVYSDILITKTPGIDRVVFKPKLENAGSSAVDAIFYKKTPSSWSVGTLYHYHSQGYRFNKLNKKMPTITATGRSVNSGLGIFAFPMKNYPLSLKKRVYSATSNGKKVLSFYLNKDNASNLSMETGYYTVFCPDIKESLEAMGFSPKYYSGVTLPFSSQIKGIGNSWHVTVVKMIIESYCSRMGWIR